MRVFEETAPSLDRYWRGIMLFGRNIASSNFSLGQSLLDLGS